MNPANALAAFFLDIMEYCYYIAINTSDSISFAADFSIKGRRASFQFLTDISKNYPQGT